MTKRTFVLPVYVVRCVYKWIMFVFICAKITDFIYKDIELFWYRYFVYKMTTNLTEEIAS